MATTRMVKTVFWEDNYTANLDPIEKLLFLYLITNPSTNICGIYQITIRKMAVETGIDKDMVEKVLRRFERDGKLIYQDGWIGIKNFIKNQNQRSPKVQEGIRRELELVPAEITKGMDTLSHLTQPNLTQPNGVPSTRKRVREAKKPTFNPLGAEILKAFELVDPKNKTYYGNTTQRGACDFLLDEHGLEHVLRVVKILPKTNGTAYFPTITSPNDLKEKWSKLESALVRKKSEPKTKGRGIEL